MPLNKDLLLGKQNSLEKFVVKKSADTEAIRTYLPGTGTLSWMLWCAAGIPHSQRYPS